MGVQQEAHILLRVLLMPVGRSHHGSRRGYGCLTCSMLGICFKLYQAWSLTQTHQYLQPLRQYSAQSPAQGAATCNVCR